MKGALSGQAPAAPEPGHGQERRSGIPVTDHEIDHVVVAGVDRGELLRDRIRHADRERPPAPASLPRERDDEEKAEKRITGMQ